MVGGEDVGSEGLGVEEGLERGVADVRCGGGLGSRGGEEGRAPIAGGGERWGVGCAMTACALACVGVGGARRVGSWGLGAGGRLRVVAVAGPGAVAERMRGRLWNDVTPQSVARGEDAREGEQREARGRDDGGESGQALDGGHDALGDAVLGGLLDAVSDGAVAPEVNRPSAKARRVR